MFIKPGDTFVPETQWFERIFGLQENTERIFKGKIYSFSNSEDLKRRYTYRYFKYQAKI